MNEKERLLNMFSEHKISENDFKVLSEALEKKTSFANFILSFSINPFEKIAGLKALIIGMVIILGTSFFGVIAKIYFVGVLGSLNAVVVKNPKMQLNFFLLFYQNVVAWLILTMLFIIAAKIFQQKRLRVIDFLGTVALSRFPLLILVIFLSIMRIMNPSLMDIDLTKGVKFELSIISSLFVVVVLICYMWQIATYFYALKESSGLSGKKLWISFIAAILLGEIIASPLTTMFI